MQHGGEFSRRQAFKGAPQKQGGDRVPFEEIRQRKGFKPLSEGGFMKRGVLAADYGIVMAEKVEFFDKVEKLALAAAELLSIVKVKYGEPVFHHKEIFYN